jgi:hypothetical protein
MQRFERALVENCGVKIQERDGQNGEYINKHFRGRAPQGAVNSVRNPPEGAEAGRPTLQSRLHPALDIVMIGPRNKRAGMVLPQVGWRSKPYRTLAAQRDTAILAGTDPFQIITNNDNKIGRLFARRGWIG